MSKTIKSMMMREYKDRFSGAQDGMLIGLRGLKATDQTALRNTLAKNKVRVTVVRNHLARKVVEGTPLAPFSDMLSGSSAVVAGGLSVVEIARAIVKMTEKMPAIELKGAVLDGTLYSGKAGVTELSKFPTRSEAIGNIVTLIVSPGRTLLGLVKGPGATIGGIVKAIEAKLEKGETIAAAG
jgi:large subunit ribosomal protein L10